MMEDDPDKINDEARQIEARIFKEGEAYAETRNASRALNSKRAESRKRIDALGIRTDAYQTGIRIVKDLTDGERKDFMRDLALIIKVLGKRQAELFPDEAIKAAKRIERAKAKAADAKAKSIERGDTMPRSNPRKGGAGGVSGRKPASAKPTPEELSAAAAAAPGAHEDEQQAGGDVLQEHIDRMKDDAPKSQSAQVAAINEKLGMP